MRYNKLEYSTAAGVYCTAHDFKAPFCMPEFSSSKIINHCFHLNNDKGESGIGYDMIIGRELMVQIFLMVYLNHQFLQWDGAIINIKEPISLLGKSNITKREMSGVVMQTAETASTREAIARMVKLIESNYAK